MDFTNFTTLMTAVDTAMQAGDYATARMKAAQARIAFFALPQSVVTGERSTEFRKSLDEVSKAIDAHEQASSGGGGTLLLPVQIGRAR